MTTGPSKAKLEGYAFVFKANGMPRIDRPIDVPQENWDTLTLEQKNYANDQVVEELKKPIK
jgi:hypothetical protein